MKMKGKGRKEEEGNEWNGFYTAEVAHACKP